MSGLKTIVWVTDDSDMGKIYWQNPTFENLLRSVGMFFK